MRHITKFLLLTLLFRIPIFTQTVEEEKKDIDKKYKAFAIHVKSIVKGKRAVVNVETGKPNSKSAKNISNYDKEIFEYKLGYVMGDLYLTLDLIDKNILQKENVGSFRILISELGKVIEGNKKYTGNTKIKFGDKFRKLISYKDLNVYNQEEIINNTKSIRDLLDTLWTRLFPKIYSSGNEYEKVTQSAAFWYYSHCEEFMPEEEDKQNCKVKKFGKKTASLLTDEFNKRFLKELEQSLPKGKISEKQYEENFKNKIQSYFKFVSDIDKMRITKEENRTIIQIPLTDDYGLMFYTPSNLNQEKNSTINNFTGIQLYFNLK